MNAAALARRARWEVQRGDPHLAVRLLLRAAESAEKAGSADEALSFCDDALDLCLNYFPSDDDETFEVAKRVDGLSGGDARASKAIGVRHSVLARRAWSKGSRDEATAEFTKAEVALDRAISLLEDDADARSCLGGLYRRRAEWTTKREEAAEFETKALSAYEEGARRSQSAYPVLNAIEYGAVVRHRRDVATAKAAGATAGQTPSAVLFLSDADPMRARLEKAIFIRRKQLARNEDAPWPAFDLARGNHYLKPNVLRMLADLDVAIEDVRRVARGPSDNWMLESAARSYRELYEAEVPIDGLDEALQLLQRAAFDDRWSSADWGSLAEQREPYLAKELGELRAGLEALRPVAAQGKAAAEVLQRFIDATKHRWTIEDEERFQRETDAFLKGIEPAGKRVARTLFKAAGGDAAQAGLELLLTPVPGGSLIAKVVSGVLKHAVEGALKEPGGTTKA